MRTSLVRLSAPGAATRAPNATPAPRALAHTQTDPAGNRVFGDIRVEHEVEGPVLWLRGEVDAVVVHEFECRWTAAPPPLIAIDAGETTFVDSSAVAFLLRWARAASILGTTAVLRRSSPRLDRVLDLMGLTSILAQPHRTSALPVGEADVASPSNS